MALAVAPTLAVPPQNLGNRAKRVTTISEGPWKEWRGSRHARAIRFMETYCRPNKGTGHGKPLKLAKFQKEFLEQILADGIDASVLTTPRGNGKSTFGGGLAVWATFDDDETGAPQVPIVATTITQAIRSCYGVAAAMVKAEPELLSRCLIYTGIAQPRIVVPGNGGELFPISNDPDGLQGLDYSLALFDEIGYQPLESWDSLRLASGKRERSLIIGMGTPGLDHENALWQLRKMVHEGARLPGFVYREHTAPEGCAIDDRAAWRIANPALRSGFLRKSALETDLGMAEGGGALESHFRLFRLNQWVEGTDAWLGPDGRKVWMDLADPWPFEPQAPTWVGVDVGIKRDSTAVVCVQRRPDGLLHARCRLWVPSQDEPVDVTDVMHHIRGLAGLYAIKSVSFDARFFDVPAKMLSDEGIHMLEVPQSVERMTPIIGGLLEVIKRGEMRHDGDGPFATQVLNAVPRYSERGFTLQKSKSRGRIDAVIALSLAIDRAVWDSARKPRKPRVMVGY